VRRPCVGTAARRGRQCGGGRQERQGGQSNHGSSQCSVHGTSDAQKWRGAPLQVASSIPRRSRSTVRPLASANADNPDSIAASARADPHSSACAGADPHLPLDVYTSVARWWCRGERPVRRRSAWCARSGGRNVGDGGSRGRSCCGVSSEATASVARTAPASCACGRSWWARRRRRGRRDGQGAVIASISAASSGSSSVVSGGAAVRPRGTSSGRLAAIRS
jgi:hypothetical protein